ncbi:amino acid adenylation domain-containing protein [Kordia sp. TARA_039_SRF]|nr:amino acid adenylation domain-containing protein [Kordia sp. TARA_039_SRF]
MKLTLPQQDIYFEQLLYTEDPIYNIGAAISIKGNISYDILNKAYTALIDQHDAYRSIVVTNTQGATIEMLHEHTSQLGYEDFSAETSPKEKAAAFMKHTFQQVFRFEDKTLLHKFILIKVEESFHYLFSMYHHIITDGWGTSLMFQRLVKNYNELANEEKISSEYPYSYQDFAIDDEKYVTSEDFQKDKLYWKEKFKNLPDRFLHTIKYDGKKNKSSRKELLIKRSMYNELEQLAKETRSSTFHIILAVLYLYFGRKHQVNELAIGLPVLNRSKSIFKKTVGLFMGVSPLRIELDFETAFTDLILQIKQQLRQDYRHQRFPLGKLIHELELFEDKDRLFNITLSYEKQNYADHFKDTVTKVVPMTHESERVALALYIREFDTTEDVKIDFDYNLNYFDADSIEKVVQHFELLLHEVAKDHTKKLKTYTYITPAEQKKLLETFNQTKFEIPKKTVCALYEEQANNNANQFAVIDQHKAYTYKALQEKSNQIANYIREHFSKVSKSPIAVLMNRSADLIAVLLGILKSGHSYIPLDPTFPVERLQYIMQHSEVSFLFGDAVYKNLLNNHSGFVNVSEVVANEALSTQDVDNSTQESDAYIIYTSGSTGNPKGVKIAHNSLVNFLKSIQHKQKITSEDILYSVTTQSFDISILEFFLPITVGGSVYIANKKTLSDPFKTIEEIEKMKPTVMQATPSFYQMLFNAGWKGDKKLKILCGGDLLNQALASQLLENSKEVWNMYGPTETTIWSSTKQIKTPKDASNIGSPIFNTQLYVLDRYKKLVPQGVQGDIYISGDGLATGYLKDLDLTNRKFTKHPFLKNKKIYHTGDIGKWNENGEILFLGRNDYQVKIRGYRIELGEIEAALNACDEIKTSTVIAKKEEVQEAFLIAYVIPEHEAIDTHKIMEELHTKLPQYMIPNFIETLEAFPLTPNKKIDRKKLSEMNIHTLSSTDTFEKPLTNIEIKISDLFKNVLAIEKEISNTDNFFALGGHSLNAVRLISLIEREFYCRLSLKNIFEAPSVKALATLLESGKIEKTKPIVPIAEQSDYPITASQYALWLAALSPEKSIAYNMFAAFKITGVVQRELLEKALVKIINRHEILRTNFLEVDGLPRQKITHKAINTFHLDELEVEDENIEDAIVAYACREFDLANELLVRLGVLKTTSGDSYMVFSTHHIIMDGWSLEVLINELAKYYKALTVNGNSKEEKLPFQFKDYVTWLAEEERVNTKSNQEFWSTYLQSYQWKNLIKFDTIEEEQSQTVAMYYFAWDTIVLNDLIACGVRHNTTLHTLLITAFNVLIHKMYQHEDICIATVNSGRNFSDSHSQMGMFVKTLPLRSKISGSQTFLDIVHATHQNLLLLDTHQNMPAEVHNKLRFEILMVLQNTKFNYDTIDLHEELQLNAHPIKSTYNRLPLLIDFHKKHTELSGTVNYDTSKYEKETLELIFTKYKKVIDQIIEQPTIQINAIDIDLPFEKEEAIEIDFNF